jgi:phage repressor protein C with HTH and peptisase S24 domain
MGLSMAGETKRYNHIREKAGLSKKDFAESLGLSFSMNYQISSGKIKLPRDLLDRLVKVYNVNLHWFLTGQGKSGMDSDTAEIELLEQEAAAGQGKEIADYIEKQYIPILYDFVRPHRPENLKAVFVSGDSMIGERINDGDIAIINIKQTEGNGIYVVSIGNTLVVKRVDFDLSNKTITLISANPAYDPRRYSGAELENISIAGRVIACYHKL